MQWQDLGSAIALMLIIEGMLPFLMPNRFRALAETLRQIDGRTIRIVGFLSMLLGLIMIYLVRS